MDTFTVGQQVRVDAPRDSLHTQPCTIESLGTAVAWVVLAEGGKRYPIALQYLKPEERHEDK